MVMMRSIRLVGEVVFNLQLEEEEVEIKLPQEPTIVNQGVSAHQVRRQTEMMEEFQQIEWENSLHRLQLTSMITMG